jgi:hypothetical protein
MSTGSGGAVAVAEGVGGGRVGVGVGEGRAVGVALAVADAIGVLAARLAVRDGSVVGLAGKPAGGGLGSAIEQPLSASVKITPAMEKRARFMRDNSIRKCEILDCIHMLPEVRNP